jgi:hypothetical protein
VQLVAQLRADHDVLESDAAGADDALEDRPRGVGGGEELEPVRALAEDLAALRAEEGARTPG